MKLMELKNKFSREKSPCPPSGAATGSFRTPLRFWQGGPGRVHDRFMYKLQENGSWTIERLQP